MLSPTTMTPAPTQPQPHSPAPVSSPHLMRIAAHGKIRGYVASALAAKTVVRSGSGAAMPLFITAMYHNLGNGWAASTWAFISLAMVRFHVQPQS